MKRVECNIYITDGNKYVVKTSNKYLGTYKSIELARGVLQYYLKNGVAPFKSRFTKRLGKRGENLPVGITISYNNKYKVVFKGKYVGIFKNQNDAIAALENHKRRILNDRSKNKKCYS